MTAFQKHLIYSSFLSPNVKSRVDYFGRMDLLNEPLLASEKKLLDREKNNLLIPNKPIIFSLEGKLINVDGNLVLEMSSSLCLVSSQINTDYLNKVVNLNGPFLNTKKKKNEESTAVPRQFQIILRDQGSFTILKLIHDKKLKTKEEKQEIKGSYAPRHKPAHDNTSVPGLPIKDLISVRSGLLSSIKSDTNSLSEFSVL